MMWSETTGDLTARIVVAACRDWVRGVEPWRKAVRSFARHFPPAQGRNFAFHLGALLAVLASAGNQRIVVGPVGSSRLWPGEQILLDAIALGRGGFSAGLDTLLARHLDPSARPLAVYHLHGVVASLATATPPDVDRASASRAGVSATVLAFPAAQAQSG